MKQFLCVLLLGCSATAQSASVSIHEVLYDGIGSDADDVFTELSGTPGLSLDGWLLKGVNGSNGDTYRTLALDGVVIPDDGILVIATTSANATLAALTDWIANVDWQNGPDAVQLWFGETLIDALQYGDAGTFNAGEGQFAWLAAAGESLSRNAYGFDSDDNRADFSAGIATPGAGPSPVPVPAALWLLLSALGSAAMLRKQTT